jgi:hypothetical protein
MSSAYSFRYLKYNQFGLKTFSNLIILNKSYTYNCLISSAVTPEAIDRSLSPFSKSYIIRGIGYRAQIIENN